MTFLFLLNYMFMKLIVYFNTFALGHIFSTMKHYEVALNNARKGISKLKCIVVLKIGLTIIR